MTGESSTRKGLRFFASWSGGKDSTLALYRMVHGGHLCSSLLTMLDETGESSRSHGLSPQMLTAHAEALGIPILMANASWESYEAQLKKSIELFKAQGIVHGVFGDIDLEPHREWVERVCRESGVTEHEPLWRGNRRELVREFLGAGFQAILVVVSKERIPAEFLGRQFDENLVQELEAMGIDSCGESGEFHTFVYDGPLFHHAISFKTGAPRSVGNCLALPLLEGESRESLPLGESKGRRK